MPDKINQMINHAQIAWDEFMDSDTESSTIRPLIMESWKRCRTHRVDPYKTISKRLPDKLYEETLKENKTLIQVAKPIMDGLLGIVKDSSYAIILTDAQGVILDMIWSIQGMDHISELNFMKGCRWTEDSVGTNAIGTALHLKAPVQTLGAEHYCIDQHMWTCSAAPIKNEKGEVIGIIDLSGNFIDYHPHTLAMVVAAASSISNQIQLIENRKWVDTAYDLIQEGILILDSHLVIKDYNKALSSILEVTMHEIEGLNIPEFLQDIECNFDLKKIQEPIELDEVALHVNKRRKEFGVTMSPVLENGKFLGLVLSIRKTEKIRSVVNRVIGNTSSYDFPDIVTQDHEMLTIIESAKRIAQTKSTVLIHGESGTGKELFAHAIHKNSLFSDGPFVAVNCGALPQDLIESELLVTKRVPLLVQVKVANLASLKLLMEVPSFLMRSAKCL